MIFPCMAVEVLIAHPPLVYKYIMWVQAIMTAHLIGRKSPRNPVGDAGRQMFKLLYNFKVCLSDDEKWRNQTDESYSVPLLLSSSLSCKTAAGMISQLWIVPSPSDPSCLCLSAPASAGTLPVFGFLTLMGPIMQKCPKLWKITLTMCQGIVCLFTDEGKLRMCLCSFCIAGFVKADPDLLVRMT